MKRVILVIAILISCLYSFAQKSSAIIDLGYRTKFDNANWGMGGQFKYNLPYNLRAAADVMAYFPQNSDLGLDVGLNLQYLLKFDRVGLYPVIGIVMSSHSFSAEPNSRDVTDFGLSLGAGAEFNLSRRSFINIDYKYYLINKDRPFWYTDYANIRIGYGFRF